MLGLRKVRRGAKGPCGSGLLGGSWVGSFKGPMGFRG